MAKPKSQTKIKGDAAAKFDTHTFSILIGRYYVVGTNKIYKSAEEPAARSVFKYF